MTGYNRIIMAGNLTKDPELRSVGNGSVCRFTIASNRQYRNKQTGGNVQEVCFIDVDVWGPQADNCKLYIQKGKAVLVEGRLKLDTWKDAEGNTRSKHTIVADRVIFLSTGGETSQEESIGDESSFVTENSKGAKTTSFEPAKENIKVKESSKQSKGGKDTGSFKETPFAVEDEDLLF